MSSTDERRLSRLAARLGLRLSHRRSGYRLAEIDDTPLLDAADLPALAARLAELAAERQAAASEPPPHQGSAAVLVGDARAVLATLPARYCQAAVTSPPYFQARDYGHPEQIGQEATPQAYISALATVFDEVQRVLRSDGCLWVVIGDAYVSNPSTTTIPRTAQGNGSGRFRVPAAHHLDARRGRANRATAMIRAGFPLKSLIGIPGLLIAEMQRRGWVSRANITWVKSVAMPENTRDRPSTTTERVLLFSLRRRYLYHRDAVPEAQSDVWTLPTNRWRGDHRAMFPLALADRCIRLSTNPGDRVLDPFGGGGTTAVAAVAAGRDASVVELNPEYAQQIRRRLLA